MTSYLSFNDLADQIADKKQFNDLIARQQKIFQINPFKIEKLYSETVKKIYAQILAKYQVTNEFKVLQNVWQQNERRVFVWYIIVLFDVWSLDPKSKNQIQWESLCNIFFGKNPSFLEFQFANILKSKAKITWNQSEDNILLDAMSKQMPGKWNEVSKRIFYESGCALFKSPKHCRERWFNHLDESKNKGSWTLQEDYAIFKFIIEKGKRWACMVKQMGNQRTENMIKNRYNSLICRFKKNKKRREEQVAEIIFKGLETEVKNQRRERRLQNAEKQTLKNKPATVQIQTGLQQIPQKSSVSEEDKSENTTQKNVDVKIEEEVNVSEEIGVKNVEMGDDMNEKLCYGSALSFYNYPQPFMDIQSYQGFYFYQMPSFSPIDQGFAFFTIDNVQNQ